MSSSEHSNTQQDVSHHSDAIADMQDRLVQFGRLVVQVRDGLPAQHAEALRRIEHGIAGLSQRVATFGRDGQRQSHAVSPSAPPAPADAEELWDPQSAEELMRAYEAAEAEFSRAAEQPRTPQVRQWPNETAAAGPQAAPSHDQAWLEARLADISASLHRSLADIDPTPSLAALDQRLDLFEQRLEGAFGDIALDTGRGDLKLMDAHIAELAEHFQTIRQQLTRLDAMDDQLRELANALDGQQQPPGAEAAALREDDIAALIDTTAERVASRFAASMPADAGGQGRIDSLEGMLQDYVAERRRSEETSAGILRTIEDALVRIIDRVETMDTAKPATPSPALGDIRDRDEVEAEHDRLAEAYAVGARVLGHQATEPSLHAADYVAGGARDRGEMPAEPAPAGRPEETAPQEEETRQELRASAMRAKLKAQATPREPASENATPDEFKADMLGHGRARTLASTRSGSHRFSLLLGAAMALLFGAGFVGVNSFMTNAPLAGASQKASATMESGRASSLAPSTSQQGNRGAQPAVQPGKD